MPRVRELDGEHLEFWQECHLCTVTTIRRDGSPHVAEGREPAAESVAEAVRRYAERYRQPRENPERVALRITISSAVGNV